jgi:hypothetical protein
MTTLEQLIQEKKDKFRVIIDPIRFEMYWPGIEQCMREAWEGGRLSVREDIKGVGTIEVDGVFFDRRKTN